ncbi:MAG: choice-of-anchor D domain-containing protein, partial [Bacteroidetes bacterium]
MKKLVILCCLFHLFTVTLVGQTLSVFDVDTSGFPTIKAKFFAFDKDGKQITNLSTSDFQVKENGQLRNVTNVSCPSPIPPTAISSVLVMDVSGSMCGEGLNMAKAAANVWINILPFDKSECAITSFSDDNYINQDFTTDKTKLINAINSLVCIGGTDYNAAMIDPPGGGLLIAQRGKHKRVIVFLSDGGPNFEPNTSQIIAMAKANNISIYCVTIGMSAPQCMKDFANQTGGLYFENIRTKEDAENCYLRILQIAQGGEPCSIEWQSGVNCTGGEINIYCKHIPYNINTTTGYKAPASSIAFLECRPTGVFFKNKPIGVPVDTNIIITARNADFNITNITSSDPNFDVNPKSFSLPKGYSIAVTMRYIPPDSNRYYTTITIENDLCQKRYLAVGSFIKKDVPPKSTLKVTHPNGGEIFVIGSDTVITWEGVFQSEKVKLEYSKDNGNNWKLITDTASGLNYNWKNIPKTTSNQCLVRATHEKGLTSDTPEIEWDKCYGNYEEEFPYSIQETNDGGFIVAGYSNPMFLDVKVVKLNSIGTIEWEKSYGGNNDDCAKSIKQTPDGGYIFTGYTNSKNDDVSGNHGREDAWVVKLSATGEIQWQKCLGGSEDDEANDIALTSDGGYLVACNAYSKDGDVSCHKDRFERENWIVKLNSVGEIVWQKSYEMIGASSALAIKETSDGGIIYTISSDFKYLVIKLTSNGDFEWETSMPGDDSIPFSIGETSDGGYIVGGTTWDNSLNGFHYPNTSEIPSDYLLVKLGKTGEMEWYKCLGGYNYEWEGNVCETIDGGYIVVCTTFSNDGDVNGNHGGYEEEDRMDYWVVKLSISGDIQWQKCLGGTREDHASDVKETSDGGFIIAGYTRSNDGDISNYIGQGDYWIVKLSPIGGIFQQDSSDSNFSIVAPQAATTDIDMKQVLVGTIKDSVITGFITNTGSYPCRIDSIYFEGADKDQFALVSGFPPFIVDSGNTKSVEFRFKPTSVGNKSSNIVIITQADTLRQGIIGEGVIQLLSIENKLIDFGKVLVGSNKDTLAIATITNIGTASITIDSTKHNKPNDYDFSTLAGSAPFTLNADETANMDLRFKPSDVGRTSGVLEFYYNGVGSPAVITLYGEGVSDTVSVPYDFSNTTGNVQLYSINPNPASDEAEIEFELIESNRTQLIVTNILGEKVLTLLDGTPELGRQKITFNTNELTQGNYFVIL